MNIKEAVKLLLEGEKIRLSRWHEGRYLRKHHCYLMPVLNQRNEEYRITLSDMLADDWEIYF
jgi:hypothetical protein